MSDSSNDLSTATPTPTTTTTPTTPTPTTADDAAAPTTNATATADNADDDSATPASATATAAAAAATVTPTPTPPERQRLRFATVCASNQNRSMEAHYQLARAGLDVRSYGVSTHVKLPGPAIDKPNVYEFGTPYRDIYADLRAQNEELYRANDVLRILERNQAIKTAPQRFQDDVAARFDLIIAYEERVFDSILDDLHMRPNPSYRPVHVVCIATKDNFREAVRGAEATLAFCQLCEQTPRWEERVDELTVTFYEQHGRTVMHQVAFY